MTNNQLLGAISQDIYRVATHYHRGSFSSAEKFAKNAEELIGLVELDILPVKVQNTLKNLPQVLREPDRKLLADKALVYSIILRYSANKNDTTS